MLREKVSRGCDDRIEVFEKAYVRIVLVRSGSAEIGKVALHVCDIQQVFREKQIEQDRSSESIRGLERA